MLHPLGALLLVGGLAASATGGEVIDYFGQDPPPADRPALFAPGIVSVKGRWEEKITFSPDGREAFWGVHPKHDYFAPKVMHARFDRERWSKPSEAPLNLGPRTAWPLMAADGKTLFFEKNLGDHGGEIVAARRRENGGWSTPETILLDAPAKKGLGLAQTTRDGTLYFYTRHERVVYSCRPRDRGGYTQPEPLSFQINPAVEFFISPAGDYAIFQPISWNSAMHVSFRLDGEWSLPISLREFFKPDNGWDANGFGPSVSPDGMYLFFAKSDPGYTESDIYWVKTDFLNALRKQAEAHRE